MSGPGWVRALPWGVALVAPVIYGLTLAPGLTWRHDGADGGDLVSAAYTLGVAHPPGYPTYLLVGRLFSLLPWGDVAHRLNVMSAAFATGAALLSYWTAVRLTKAAAPSPALSAVAAAVAALGLATSSILWSQAVVAEVYTLQLFLTAAVALCLLKWRDDARHPRWLWLAGLLGGAGLGSHLTLGLVLLPAAALIAWTAWSQHTSRPTILKGVVSFLLGLSVFLYLPWRAAQDPPINWGQADTWSGFGWLVSGTPYRHLVFGLPWEHLPQRISALASVLGTQFQWWGLFLALIGLRYLWQKDRPWALFSCAVALSATAYATTYNTTDSYVYLLPTVLALSWWLSMGLVQLMGWMARRPGAHRIGLAALFLGLLAIVPGVNVARAYSAQDLSQSQEAEVYARSVWQVTEPKAIILSGRDAQLFALWYFDVVEEPRTGRSVVAYLLLQYPWYQRQLGPALLGTAAPLSYRDALEALVRTNLGQRPIYVTEDPSAFLVGYRATPVEDLWRLEPP